MINSQSFKQKNFNQTSFITPNCQTNHNTYSTQHYSILFFFSFSKLFSFFLSFSFLSFSLFFFLFLFVNLIATNTQASKHCSPQLEFNQHQSVNTPYFLRQGKNSNHKSWLRAQENKESKSIQKVN